MTAACGLQVKGILFMPAAQGEAAGLCLGVHAHLPFAAVGGLGFDMRFRHRRGHTGLAQRALGKIFFLAYRAFGILFFTARHIYTRI